jgi:hypothetical protein
MARQMLNVCHLRSPVTLGYLFELDLPRVTATASAQASCLCNGLDRRFDDEGKIDVIARHRKSAKLPYQC